ncbi:MAG TPA: hypothetical protein VFL91_14080 [Thermomicrobiales bacterium]|nr:hypothetical protein [Thermomicrobiales bacterium]
MELLTIVAALVLLDVAALRWGADSRAGARGSSNTGGILPQTGSGGATGAAAETAAKKGDEMINVFELEQRVAWRAADEERRRARAALLRQARAARRPLFRQRLARVLVALARRLDPAAGYPAAGRALCPVPSQIL